MLVHERASVQNRDTFFLWASRFGPSTFFHKVLNMNLSKTTLVLFLLGYFVSGGNPGWCQLRPDGATASFQGALPPKKTVELAKEALDALKARWQRAERGMESLRQHPRAADADIFVKAVRYAIEFDEWYDKKPEDCLRKANALLEEAERRMVGLKNNQTPWLEGTGQKVLGFYSRIDDSPQPYGMEIPADVKLGSQHPPIPMWIWLHGRGDTTTDLNFVYNQLTTKKAGQFNPRGTIIIHPFGRYCNGWKSAGETDVLEAMNDAVERFHVDRNRIALAGFSMGGAGAWHLGAHFTDLWACVHTGAGFVDVKRYQKLTPQKMPGPIEQLLWGVYDVPNYVHNFANVPLVCYSGETDAQRDSAEYMVEELGKIGLVPPHLIGPDTGHKYHPEVIKDVQSRIEQAVAKGKENVPTTVTLQTRTLAYNKMHWLQITQLHQHWENSFAKATLDPNSQCVRIETVNVDGLKIQLPIHESTSSLKRVILNGNEISQPFVRNNGELIWEWSKEPKLGPWKKKHGLQGPMDDGLKSRFVVVLPDLEESQSPVDQWVQIESKHFITRWRSLMRGEPRVMRPKDVTENIQRDSHLVIWGTPSTNSLLRQLMKHEKLGSILQWDNDWVRLGNRQSPALSSVPVMCYPNPTQPDRYIILNTGLTFREAHDRTNSLQNPKLPDWAILDISQAPSNEAAGKVVHADFFDEHWQVKSRGIQE